MDSGQMEAMFALILTGAMLGAIIVYLRRATIKHVTPRVNRAEQAIGDYVEKRKKQYNDLPDLGKARVDKNVALVAKYGGTALYAAAIGGVLAAAGVTGGWLLPLIFSRRYVINNWKKQSGAVKEAENRRSQILNPTVPPDKQA
jgi:hypothetical protein